MFFKNFGDLTIAGAIVETLHEDKLDSNEGLINTGVPTGGKGLKIDELLYKFKKG